MPVGRPFQPGHSGNPLGRPKALSHVRARLQEEGDRLVQVMLITALDRRHPKHVEALKLAMAYAYGQPNQPITGVDGEGGIKVDPADLIAQLKRVAGEA